MRARLEQAVSLMREGNYEEAIKGFNSIIKETGSSSMIFNRGLCYYLKEDYEPAKVDLLKVFKKGAKEQAFPKAIYYLGQIASKTGDVKEEAYWKVEWDKLSKKTNKKEEQEENQDSGKIAISDKTTLDEDGAIKSIAFFKSDTTFKDVVGSEDIKKYMDRHVIQALKNPALYKEYGKKLGDGVVLYGASGVGKTYITKAVAGEAGANVIIVRINEILSQFVGLSEKNLNIIFTFARQNAPCIIFFDEIDALGGRRHSSSDVKGEGSVMRNIINSLLVEMSGIESNPEGIFVIGATNKPWDLDPALKRSGRFNDCVYLKPPNFKERKALIEYYLKGKLAKNINSTKLSLALAGYAQADICRVMDISLLAPLSHAIKTGIKRPLSTEDVLNTIKTELPESPLTTWFFDARSEVIGKEEVQVIDKKIHSSWKSGVLDSGEKLLYRQLILDIKKHTSNFDVNMTKFIRMLGYSIP